ncbi:hypothetical protein BJ742DRAFT_767296 [Cladochytrium replicatum]|nr:hypothetical protein BJ742DRAFT_767296 [Cladochytrium replicatum]
MESMLTKKKSRRKQTSSNSRSPSVDSRHIHDVNYGSQLHVASSANDIDSILGAASGTDSVPAISSLVNVQYPEAPTIQDVPVVITDTTANKDVLESLDALKRASLQALNSLVRRLIEDEINKAEDTANSSGACTPNTQERPASFESPEMKQVSTSAPAIRTSNSGSELQHIVDRLGQISDGGQIAAALNQTMENRSMSRDLLNRSNDALNHLTANSAPEHTNADGQFAQLVAPALSGELMTDHGLAVALAALCNGLYQIMESETSHIVVASGNPAVTHSTDASILPEESAASLRYSGIFQSVADVQNWRPQIDLNVASEETRALWNEIDRLMLLVQAICQERRRSRLEIRQSPLPTYEEALSAGASSNVTSKSPRKEFGDAIQDEKGRAIRDEIDLGDVVDAIERVMNLAPRMLDQSVALNDRQQRMMSNAQLTALVDRLSRGRFHDQRASPSARWETLNVLVDNITIAGQRSLQNQRAGFSKDGQQRMDEARLGSLIARQEKSRYTNQDWESKEERLIADLSTLQHDLEKCANRMNEQRFVMTPAKEKKLYMSNILKRVDKMNDRRLDSQSAEHPQERRIQELERIMDRLPPSLSDQRSTLRVGQKGLI